jgi:hypothetical protein
VLGQYSHGPGADRRRIEPLVDDAQRERIDHLDFLDRFVVRNPGREVARIHDGRVGEPHVGCPDRPAVVEPDAGAQVKLDYGVVFDGRQQRFGERCEIGLGNARCGQNVAGGLKRGEIISA